MYNEDLWWDEIDNLDSDYRWLDESLEPSDELVAAAANDYHWLDNVYAEYEEALHEKSSDVTVICETADDFETFLNTVFN